MEDLEIVCCLMWKVYSVHEMNVRAMHEQNKSCPRRGRIVGGWGDWKRCEGMGLGRSPAPKGRDSDHVRGMCYYVCEEGGTRRF